LGQTIAGLFETVASTECHGEVTPTHPPDGYPEPSYVRGITQK
jgi:hypothetical protein